MRQTIPILLCSLWLFLFVTCKLEKKPEFPIRIIANLPGPLNETSGLAHAREGTVYLHNDSDNKPELYEVSLSNGQINRTIRFHGVKNTDWEELAEDSSYLYIGNFGNNFGNRKDLSIIKVVKSAAETMGTVFPELIYFHYPEQKSFSYGDRHNFDCEAMFAYGDSLYLFTKNRGDGATDIYQLPKSPGTYAAKHIGRFDARGLITAADFLPGEKNKLVLLGYETGRFQNITFLWIFSGFPGIDFMGAMIQRLDLAYNLQAEAILFASDSTLIMTNEDELGLDGRIYQVNLKSPLLSAGER